SVHFWTLPASVVRLHTPCGHEASRSHGVPGTEVPGYGLVVYARLVGERPHATFCSVTPPPRKRSERSWNCAFLHGCPLRIPAPHAWQSTSTCTAWPSSRRREHMA